MNSIDTVLKLQLFWELMQTVHEELTTAIGTNTPSYRTVARWASHFREATEDVNDNPQSSLPASQLPDSWFHRLSTMIHHIPLVMRLHLRYRSLSHSTIERIIHHCFKMKKNDISLGISLIER